MAYCTNCGKKLPDGVMFCEHCGAPQMVSTTKAKQSSLVDDFEGMSSANGFGTGMADEKGNTGANSHAGADEGTDVNESAENTGNVDMDAAFDAAFQEAVPPKKEKKKSPIGKILLGAVAIILAVLFLLPSSNGWSEEDAKNATQAYLDYHFNKDGEGYAKYMEDMTEEEFAERRQAWWDDLFENSFDSSIPVSDSVKAGYADFFMDLRKKAEYEVGDAVKTDEGFEVPVTVKPIASFANGEFTLLDMQLNDDMTDAELNERFYTRELELLTALAENPIYGVPREIVMHIAKGEDGYEFSEEDLREIGDSYYDMDRHWSPLRAREAVEAVLGGVYGEDYAGMAEWTIATQKEIEDTLGSVFSKESMREVVNEMASDILKSAEIEEEYVVSDELAEKLSRANKNLMAGTEYEVMSVEGDEEEYVVKVNVTPYSMQDLEEELFKRLEAELDTLDDAASFITRDYELLAEIISEIIENGQYDDPVTFDLHLQYNQNKAYELDYDELAGLYQIYESGEQTGLTE